MFPPPPSRRAGGSRPAPPRVTCGRPGAAGMLGPERLPGSRGKRAVLPGRTRRCRSLRSGGSCGQAALPARVTPRVPGSHGGRGISAWGSLSAEPSVSDGSGGTEGSARLCLHLNAYRYVDVEVTTS